VQEGSTPGVSQAAAIVFAIGPLRVFWLVERHQTRVQHLLAQPGSQAHKHGRPWTLLENHRLLGETAPGY